MVEMQQQVKCSNCSSFNEIGLRFCVTCGLRLGAPCPQCGLVVPSDSRFCPKCAHLCGEGRFGKAQHKVESTLQEIECPQCGAKSDSGRRFCSACGARLLSACPKCNTPVEPLFQFCVNCGYALR
jgi:predicted amidophosphoribosyltransferase